jgi:pimeloyl-ACP methyl ester carboxylesterase
VRSTQRESSRLAASGIPVLFVGAQQDEAPFAVQRLARLVPQTRIVQLESAGHELLRDASGDVAREVADWLVDLPS